MWIKPTETKKSSKWVTVGAPQTSPPRIIPINSGANERVIATQVEQREQFVEFEVKSEGPDTQIGPGYAVFYRNLKSGYDHAWQPNEWRNDLAPAVAAVDPPNLLTPSSFDIAIVYVPHGVKVSDVLAAYNTIKPKQSTRSIVDSASPPVSCGKRRVDCGGGAFENVERFEHPMKVVTVPETPSAPRYVAGYTSQIDRMWRHNTQYGIADAASEFPTAIACESDSLGKPHDVEQPTAAIKRTLYVPRDCAIADVLAAYNSLKRFDGKPQIANPREWAPVLAELAPFVLALPRGGTSVFERLMNESPMSNYGYGELKRMRFFPFGDI